MNDLTSAKVKLEYIPTGSIKRFVVSRRDFMVQLDGESQRNYWQDMIEASSNDLSVGELDTRDKHKKSSHQKLQKQNEASRQRA